MVRILNISEGSTIAMHAAILLSKGPGKPITTNDAAESLKVSAAHLSKILQRLARAARAATSWDGPSPRSASSTCSRPWKAP